MAPGADRADVRAGQLEGRDVMVKRSRFPGCGRMAIGTNLAKGPVMLILMAGDTGRRCALEDIIDMALRTSHANMHTGQLKGRAVMVKRSRFPGRGGMAASAALAHGTIMLVVAPMAGVTIGRCTLENIIDMAPGTGRADVRAGQLEGRSVMVKRSWFPGRGRMAIGTNLSKSPLMLIRMAGDTGRWRALEDIIDVALSASHADVYASQLKGGQVVIKRSRFPGRGRMACGAILSQRSIVMIIVLVAGKTIGRRALENIIDVAFGTCRADMRTSQLEGSQVVIKRGRFPGRGGMTDTAVLAKLAVMFIIFLVTGKACGRCALENIVGMTFFALRGGVHPGQLEGSQVVIKAGRSPGCAGVTNTAVLAKLAIMVVIFLVTCKTSRRCALEDIIKMTLFTGHRDMRTHQFEGRKAVIKCGGFPGRSSMTGVTLLPKAAIVFIIFLVTGKTVCSRAFENIIGVAFFTQHAGMRTSQLENCQVVIK